MKVELNLTREQTVNLLIYMEQTKDASIVGIIKQLKRILAETSNAYMPDAMARQGRGQ